MSVQDTKQAYYSLLESVLPGIHVIVNAMDNDIDGTTRATQEAKERAGDIRAVVAQADPDGNIAHEIIGIAHNLDEKMINVFEAMQQAQDALTQARGDLDYIEDKIRQRLVLLDQ